MGAMNTLDPLNIPAFKIRAIRPFIERLTVASGSGVGGVNSVSSEADTLYSISNKNSYGADIPLEALENIEKVFNWIRQMTLATSKGKKRKQQLKGNNTSQTLPPLDSAGTNKPRVTAESDKKAKLAAKRTEQSATASRMMGGHASTDRPKRTKKLKSVDALWPVHTEILESIYRHPLLLTVLSSQRAGGSQGSKAQMLKMKKILLTVDPLNIAGNGMDLPPERIVVKLYNLVDSNEASINLNIREFTLFLYDLREKYGSEVSEYYRPASVLWWVENLRNIINVKARADKKLMVLVSKQAIEKIVMQALGLYQSPQKVTNGDVMERSISSQESSIQPLGSLSIPDNLPVSGGFADGSIRIHGQEELSQQLEANDWDVYDADFEHDPRVPQQQEKQQQQQQKQPGNSGTSTDVTRGAMNVESKLSRQDMRANFDRTGNPLQGPHSGQRTRSGGGLPNLLGKSRMG